MKKIKTKIIINASPEVVWLVLVDFPRWTSWNPFLKDVEGVALAGERVKVTINPNYEALNEAIAETHPGNAFQGAIVINKTSNFNPVITDYQAGKKLSWYHRNWLTGSYRQTFELGLIVGGKTEFVNTTEMTGFLINMGWETAVKPMYEGGMQLMNQALKLWVETDGETFNEALYEQRK